MKVNTTRFGELEVNKDDILEFSEGILGFESLKKFFIVDPGDNTLILWLQCLNDASIAFPVIEPKIFKSDYSIQLLPAELTSLSLTSVNEASVYTILTIPRNIAEMSANLKAPVVINNKTKKARQIVLQDNKLSVRFEMYKELKRRIVTLSSSDDSTRTTVKPTEEVQEHPQNSETSTPANRDKELD